MIIANTVYCSTSHDLFRSIRNGSVGAVVTDPPSVMITLDQEWAVRQVSRALLPGGAFIIICDDPFSASEWDNAIRITNSPLDPMAQLAVLWDTASTSRNRNFNSLFSTVRWYVKRGNRPAFNDERPSIFSNVLVARRVPLEHRDHMAQKPIELTNFLISTLTIPGQLVVDPFCGTGSTLVSAALLERPFVGGDIDPAMVEIATRRANQFEIETTELSPIYLWARNNLYPIEGDAP